jgi:hypothetical protein
MRKLGMLWTACFLLGGSICWAQPGPDKVCEVNISLPKPGASRQFEEARKKHNEFHRAEKDKNGIAVWEITTGHFTGSYLTSSCGLGWKDMDGNEAFDKRDGADIDRTLRPTLAENKRSYYILRPDLSMTPESATPPKMITIVHYFLKPSGISTFTDSVKRINAAMVQSKYPAKPSRWYQLVSGGDGPHYVVVTDRMSWADMQGPDQTMADMLKQVYGNDDKTMQNLRDAVDHTMSEMAEFRRDLSYMPGK